MNKWWEWTWNVWQDKWEKIEEFNKKKIIYGIKRERMRRNEKYAKNEWSKNEWIRKKGIMRKRKKE